MESPYRWALRLRPERRGHVWAYDFVEDRTHDGRKFRMLTILDEFSRECLGIVVARRLSSRDVLDTAPFPLLFRHFQPLTPPDALEPLVVDRPARLAQQRRDAAVAIAAIFR